MSSPARRGFTLVEILVAIVILGAVATSVGGAIVMMVNRNKKAIEHLEQIEVGRSATEYIRALPFDSIKGETTVVNNAGKVMVGGKYLRIVQIFPGTGRTKFQILIAKNPSYNPATDQ
jgi:prepilin-type N-terminal cleavage/methylation domain-containing protein